MSGELSFALHWPIITHVAPLAHRHGSYQRGWICNLTTSVCYEVTLGTLGILCRTQLILLAPGQDSLLIFLSTASVFIASNINLSVKVIGLLNNDE